MTRKSGGGPSKRQLRVGEELRHALAGILARGELHDPQLHGVSLTVTSVDVSPDLRNATAFVVPLGGGDPDTVVHALGRCAGHLRSQLARAVSLRYMPRLSFAHDASFDAAGRIESILRRPSVARDLDGQPDGSEA